MSRSVFINLSTSIKKTNQILCTSYSQKKALQDVLRFMKIN
jgi:hypothetical protein